MYLGMVFILSSMAVFLILKIILMSSKFIYITKFQIIPEKKAMSNLFSQDFNKYIASNSKVDLGFAQ